MFLEDGNVLMCFSGHKHAIRKVEYADIPYCTIEDFAVAKIRLANRSDVTQRKSEILVYYGSQWSFLKNPIKRLKSSAISLIRGKDK